MVTGRPEPSPRYQNSSASYSFQSAAWPKSFAIQARAGARRTGRATGLGMREIQARTGNKLGFRRWVVGELARYFDSEELGSVVANEDG